MTQARDLGDAANKANFLDNISSDIAALIASATPAGVIVPFGGTSAPTGYLACQGQIVSRSTYAALFAAIGTTWNLAGESSSEFRLPDLRGAFLRGTGSNATYDMSNGNGFAGQAVGSFETDQMQHHEHGLDWFNGNGTTDFANNYLAKAASDGSGLGNASASYTNTSVIGGPISGTAGIVSTGDETRPFNASILYCIKT